MPSLPSNFVDPLVKPRVLVENIKYERLHIQGADFETNPKPKINKYVEVTLTKRPFGLTIQHTGKWKGAYVTEICENNKVAKNCGISKGHEFIKINHTYVTDMCYFAIIEILTKCQVPVTVLLKYNDKLRKDNKPKPEVRSQLLDEYNLFRRRDEQENIMNDLYWNLRHRHENLHFGGYFRESSPLTEKNMKEILRYSTISRDPEEPYITNIKQINAQYMNMSSSGLWYLMDYVSHTRQLTFLSLVGSKLNDSDLLSLLTGITNKTPIETLLLHENLFSPKCILEFTNKIQYHDMLLKLSIDLPTWETFECKKVLVWRFTRVLADICEQKNHVRPMKKFTKDKSNFEFTIYITEKEVVENINYIMNKEKSNIIGFDMVYRMWHVL